MVIGGMSYRQTAERFNVRLSHWIIVRLKQRANQTGNVKERQRTGKSPKTTPKDDRLLKRIARPWPFSTAKRCEADELSKGALADGPSTDVLKQHKVSC